MIKAIKSLDIHEVELLLQAANYDLVLTSILACDVMRCDPVPSNAWNQYCKINMMGQAALSEMGIRTFSLGISLKDGTFQKLIKACLRCFGPPDRRYLINQVHLKPRPKQTIGADDLDYAIQAGDHCFKCGAELELKGTCDEDGVEGAMSHDLFYCPICEQHRVVKSSDVLSYDETMELGGYIETTDMQGRIVAIDSKGHEVTIATQLKLF